MAADDSENGAAENIWKVSENFQGASENFQELLRKHQRQYPLMEPQDYGKLIFQSEFGPEHMISDRGAVLAYMEEELSAMTGDASPQCSEEIGNGLCRFPLSACPSVEAAALLTDLFLLTAEKNSKNVNKPHAAVQGLQSRLELAEKLNIPGMEEWAEAWKAKGYPAVHHSEAYRKAYRPHYRLLRREYAIFFPALWEIYQLVKTAESAKGEIMYGRSGIPKQAAAEPSKEGQSKQAVIIAIDGRCGSGKTSFAELISELLPCNVVHMDDFYLPMGQRADNWMEIPGGNMDFVRFRSEVLLPARAGECVFYHPYSCQEGAYKETVPLPPCGLTIVEGSYSHHPLLAQSYDLKIFLTCSKEVQTRRLRAREGSYFPMFEERWIPMEEKYFRCCKVEEGSSFVLFTD